MSDISMSDMNDASENEPTEDWRKPTPNDRLTPKFRLLIVAIALTTICIALSMYVYVNGRRQVHENYKWLTVGYLAVPSDSISIERGSHVEKTRGCADCHGSNLEGKIFWNNWSGRISAPNLTSGKGSATFYYFDEDWVRAIKHGVGPDGAPLIGMPSADYSALSDSDLLYLIAYLKQLPPVDNPTPSKRIHFLSYLAIALRRFPPIAANSMDHSLVSVGTVKPDSTPAYGKYISGTCAGCHGANLKGATGPNLTASGDLGKWNYEQFENALRHGTLPDGRALRREMPWKSFASMNETELKALYNYFRSLN